jgi:hypothetical protein
MSRDLTGTSAIEALPIPLKRATLPRKKRLQASWVLPPTGLLARGGALRRLGIIFLSAQKIRCIPTWGDQIVQGAYDAFSQRIPKRCLAAPALRSPCHEPPSQSLPRDYIRVALR